MSDDTYIIDDIANNYTSFDGSHKHNVLLPIPNENNNYLLNRKDDAIIINCKSSWSFLIKKDNTDLDSDLNLLKNESAIFTFDGEKWCLDKNDNVDPYINIITLPDNKQIKINNGKVSFICTTYRRFYCVRRIVSQYLAQTYQNKELIVFNTDKEYPIKLGFKDNTIKIINNDIDYITNKPYTNRGDICRDAVTHAIGDYFMLADDDDVYLPWHLQQAVEGIEGIGKDAWKPEKSLFSTTHKVEMCMNTLEASVIVKMNRIREIGFRNDMTGYEGLSWYSKLRDERQLNEHNKNFIPSYCFNWSDPPEISGHKQSGDINNINNFETHKKSSNNFANELLTPISKDELTKFYHKYIEYIKNNIDEFNPSYVEKYFNNY